MSRHLEVTGEGQFIEIATRFIAEVILEVRAAKDETASADVSELARDAVKILRDSGLADSEIGEGGSGLFRPWYWKKQVGQSATRKLLLKTDDFGRLHRALEKLEPLQASKKDRKTIQVQMRQPEFESSSEAKAAALAAAFADAEVKARHLAARMGCTLGQVVSAEEGGWAKRSSGFSGDEDWGGDYSRFTTGGSLMVAAGAAAPEPELDLQKPTRTIFVKCRVRFELG